MIMKQEGRSIVLWWLIAAVWLGSGAVIPLFWAISIVMGQWQRAASEETSLERAAAIQTVDAE
jgi:hypothetical protein